MEVLLFALFFISALVFFIAGKDDFGRTESKLIIKEEENIKKKDKVAEEIKKEDKVAEEIEKEDKVAKEGNIEPQKELKKES
mgnify:CR=1 FL=1